jgi:hypothetical protein
MNYEREIENVEAEWSPENGFFWRIRQGQFTTSARMVPRVASLQKNPSENDTPKADIGSALGPSLSFRKDPISAGAGFALVCDYVLFCVVHGNSYLPRPAHWPSRRVCISATTIFINRVLDPASFGKL